MTRPPARPASAGDRPVALALRLLVARGELLRTPQAMLGPRYKAPHPSELPEIQRRRRFVVSRSMPVRSMDAATASAVQFRKRQPALQLCSVGRFFAGLPPPRHRPTALLGAGQRQGGCCVPLRGPTPTATCRCRSRRRTHSQAQQPHRQPRKRLMLQPASAPRPTFCSSNHLISVPLHDRSQPAAAPWMSLPPPSIRTISTPNGY